MNILFICSVHLCALVAAGHALLTKKNPRSALGWVAVLVFLPVMGLILYLVFGISRAQSRAERMMRKIAVISRHYTSLPITALRGEEPAGEAAIFEKLQRNLTEERLCPGNKVMPLHNGDQAYPEMLMAINNARDHVFLSSYIFSYGIAAQAFMKALEKAHQRGVDVRVLVDGVGALYSWRKPWKILASKGIRTHRFRPPSLIPPSFGINLRSHRKTLICDDTAFAGGMNIADGNIMDMEVFKARISLLENGCKPAACSCEPVPDGKHKIQDVTFRFNGPVVNQICKAFLYNWSFCDKRISELPLIEEKEAGPCACRVIMDGPGNDADPLNDLICGAINLARNKVRIMTPYFLPPSELMGSLRSAAQRGVDVRVVLPARNNLGYMTWATKRLLPGLLQAGVRVWRQPPPFAHTKLLVIDDFFSLVGSANLDSRSLRLNFELNVAIYDKALAENLGQFMDNASVRGGEIFLPTLQAQSMPAKLRNAACWIFSPYL